MMEVGAGPSRPPRPPRPSALPPLDIQEPDLIPSRPRPVSSTSKPKPNTAVDPILRNALRYTISAREYETLHKYVLSKSRLLKKRMPSVNAVEDYMVGTTAADTRRSSVSRRDNSDLGEARGKGKGKAKDVAKSPSKKGADTFNARAIRHALRVFIATGLGMKAYEVASARLKGGKE